MLHHKHADTAENSLQAKQCRFPMTQDCGCSTMMLNLSKVDPMPVVLRSEKLTLRDLHQPNSTSCVAADTDVAYTLTLMVPEHVARHIKAFAENGRKSALTLPSRTRKAQRTPRTVSIASIILSSQKTSLGLDSAFCQSDIHPCYVTSVPRPAFLQQLY